MNLSDDQTKNVAIHDDASTLTNPLPVFTVFTDGIRRLQVNATISGVDVEVDVRSLKQKAADDGQLFVVSSNVITITGQAEQAYILMRNPIGSGVNFKWDRFVVALNETSNTAAVIRVYHNPTITADGSALLEVDENNITGNTSAVQWFTGPTASSFGTFRIAFEVTNLIGLQQEFDLSHIMKPDSEMLITASKSSGSGTDIILTTWWVEIPE